MIGVGVVSLEDGAKWAISAAGQFTGSFNFVGGTIAGSGIVTMDHRRTNTDWTGGTTSATFRVMLLGIGATEAGTGEDASVD